MFKLEIEGQEGYFLTMDEHDQLKKFFQKWSTKSGDSECKQH